MDYKLKLAIITASRTIPSATPSPLDPKSGNYFQVRVMPEMADIYDMDVESNGLILPWYPNFFGDCDHAYQEGDLVWVVCEEDFSVGYIVGFAQSPAGTDISSFMYLLGSAEALAGLSQSAVNDISIQKMSDKCLTFLNVKSGRVATIYNSKIVYIYGEDGSIFSTNGSSYIMLVDKEGNLTLKGNSKSESFYGKMNTSGGDSTETLSSKTISTVNMTSINAGGSYQMTAAGNASNNVVGAVTNIAGLGVTNLAGTYINNTVALGAITNTVGAGAYTITVAGGVINILAPMVNIEALMINLIGYVSIIGGLNLLGCFFGGVLLPPSPFGFAIAGVPCAVTPLCIL